MSGDELDVLRELLAELLPAPWRHVESRYDGGRIREHYVEGGDRIIAGDVPLRDANATFIAAARNALPGLLDDLERLRGQVARVEALADEWQENAAKNERFGHFPWAMWQNRANDLRATLEAI